MHIANNKGETLCLLEIGKTKSSWVDLEYLKKHPEIIKNATCEVCIGTFNASFIAYKNEKPVIFLDMDGVCCDFIGGVAKLVNIPREDVYNNPIWEEEDSYDRIGEILGITETQLWNLIAGRSIAFWSTLKKYPWFDDMYKELKKMGDVIFLSSPSTDPFCMAGKLRWLQGEFGQHFRNYIFTPLKDVMKFDNAILIDDNEEVIEKVGLEHGVLFPQPWNSNRDRLPLDLKDFLRTTEIHLQLITYKGE